MPCETEFSRPKGLPTLITQSPTCRSAELPTSMGVTSASPKSAWITATSLEASVPTSVAS